MHRRPDIRFAAWLRAAAFFKTDAKAADIAGLPCLGNGCFPRQTSWTGQARGFGMEIVNLGVGCTFGLLVFVTVDSLSMVQIADCHSFSFLVLKSFEGNGNQLLFSIQERLRLVSKKRTSEKSRLMSKRKDFPLNLWVCRKRNPTADGRA